MKKQLNPSHILMVASVFITILFLAACGKNGASIVGTWSPSKIESITKVNGSTTKDTTYTATSVQFGFTTITFSSNGQYSELVYPGGADSTGNYTYSGGTLTFSSGVQARQNSKPTPASINGNTLTISGTLDTVLTSPLTTQQSFYSVVN
jgi:hypothetical protein